MHTENIIEKEEIKLFKKLLRSNKNKRMHIKYHVLILHYQGYTNTHIAKIMNLDPHTIAIYINSYKQKGLKGLDIGKKTGCPRFLTLEQEQQLYELIVTKTPDEVGFGYRKNWNANIVRKWVSDNFQVEYSSRGMLQVLHRLDLRYTRPTYTLEKADPEKQECFKQDFEVLKKKLIYEEIDHILFEDESMIRDYQAICKSWFPKGQQRVIPTYGKHEGVKLLGIINYETGKIYCEEHSKYDAVVFHSFLINVLKQYSTGKIVMILDNSRVHHAKLLKSFLDENAERLTLVFLPPYSPKMNIIEGLWGWMKDEVINNAFFSNVQEIRKSVQWFIDWVNQNSEAVITRLCLRM